MGFRELHVVEVKEVLRLWSRGHGMRTVGKMVGVDRKTVRRYVRAAQSEGLERGGEVTDGVLAAVALAIQPGGSVEVGCMRDHLRANEDRIRGWVAEGCRGPKLVRLLKKTTQVAVPLRTMQRFVKEDLNAGRGPATVRIVDGDPGVLEVDFLQLGWFNEIGTGKRRKLYALLCTAAHSRHQFVWPCLGQTLHDVLDGLEAAWRFFGGVFPIPLPDNLSPVVKKADAVHPTFTAAFTEYAQSRGFEVDPARVRRPKDKAKVERQVRYVRDDYFAGETFRSVEDARVEAVRWCTEEAGQRIHGRTRRRPMEAFEADEKAVLLPLPKEDYDVPRWTTYTVGRDNIVMVAHAMYSVPYALGERTLRVRSDSKTVKLYAGTRLVKTHLRQPEGGTSIDAADLPPDRAALATRDPSTLFAQADSAGEYVGVYARRLMEGSAVWSRIRALYRLMGLVRRYGDEATDEACARALEVDVVEVKRIEGMLEKGLMRRNLLAVPTPSPQGQVLRFQRPRTAFKPGGTDASA